MGKSSRPGGRPRLWKQAATVLGVVPLCLLTLPATAIAAPKPAANAHVVSVPATAHWTNTGVNVKAGDWLRITAAGTWTDGNATSGPNGSAKAWPDNFLNIKDLGASPDGAVTKTVKWGALIGFIGTTPPAPGSYTSTGIRTKAMKVFFVGKNYAARALATGRLWLNKNADAYSDFTSDNHGHVTAKISVLPPRSASQTAADARVAAESISLSESPRKAGIDCLQAVFDAAGDHEFEKLLKKAIPGAKDIYEGATITNNTVTINYELNNGDIGSATWDFGALVFDLLGSYGGSEFKVFSIIGVPAVKCVEAAFYFDGWLGGQIGNLLRQRLQPPATADAGIAGTWTLTRSTATTCIHFPAGCQHTPIPVKFAHCTSTRCAMSRTDGVWKHTHTIVRQGRTWVADFQDIAIYCGSQKNPARVIIKLTVTSKERYKGTVRAKTLAGTYVNKAGANPPNCPSNGRASEAMQGHRS
jgi:hypothetical protein